MQQLSSYEMESETRVENLVEAFELHFVLMTFKKGMKPSFLSKQ